MGYQPTERDLYVARMASWGDAWDRIEEHMIPPSREVFAYGLARATIYMKRNVASAEYAAWLAQWAATDPETMEEAP